MFRRTPAINIFLPSMFHNVENLLVPKHFDKAERKKFQSSLNILTRQTGYGFPVNTEHQLKAISGLTHEQISAKEAPFAPHPLFQMRQLELSLATESLGALAASEVSATLRPPNAVNRTEGTTRLFAQHYRSDNKSPRKRLLAFRQVQSSLAAAFPTEFLDVIDKSDDDIRIVADAHLEWLNIRGLPLGIRKNASRIPVTPGNLFVEQLSNCPLIRLTASDFSNVLVISALKRNDPIKRIFEVAFQTFEKEWKDALQVKFVEVSTEDQLVKALNEFEGPLVIFDGHGSHYPDRPASLHLMDEVCDIWSLRGKVASPPPIVVLSACDTHVADRNHATTVNGFLALGSRAVLGSVFPLNAFSAATFTARLVYRVAKFIPAAVGLFDRALSWTEIVSGMLRMQLLTDFLRQLERKNIIDSTSYFEVHKRGNIAINGLSNDPFQEVIDMLENLGLDQNQMWRELELAVSNSSVLSYLNVGRPETILVDTEKRLEKVMIPVN
jgi:hypothetical protein